MATTVSDTELSVRVLDELLGTTPLEQVGFRLWDGSKWPDSRPRAATIVLRHPSALREMFGQGTEKGLAEAFLHGHFDIVGNTEAAFELADALLQRGREGWLTSLRTLYHLRRLPGPHDRGSGIRRFRERDDRPHSVPRDREAVSFHYDLSNAFYALWLDARLLYSCAYFERPDATLDQAQEAKLQHLCRKLRLRPGQHVLDIGCGWGGFALYAAQHYGVRVKGITLSQAQAELAAARAHDAGLSDAIDIELKDYRELPPHETYDAIVSVGMSEHVGRTQLPEYFRRAHLLLRAGGVFLNHAIGEGARPRPRTGPSFIDEYVFPDSDIPPIPVVLQAAELGGFEVRDVENLREHYTLTLRHWWQRLEAAEADALRIVNEPTFRTWRLYLAGSAHGFDRGQLAVYQAVLSKADVHGRSHLPLTRADWYPECGRQ